MSKSFAHLTRLATLCLAVAAAATPAASAQQAPAASTTPVTSQSLSAPLLPAVPSLFSAKLPLIQPLSDGLGYSSSISSIAEVAAAENFLSFDNGGENGMQPAPRRRYRRPNYSDSMHNADGSNKLAFEGGVGFQIPAGSDTSNYLSTSYRFQVGAGYNWNKTFGALLQFDYDHFRLPNSVLNNEQTLYNTAIVAEGGTSADFVSSLSGSAHIWSFTLNPVVNFYTSDSWGAYAIAGFGFYHRVTNFTEPETGYCYSPYYGYYLCSAEETIDHYTSNAVGANGGFGVTWKPGRFSNERIFAEARLVHTFNTYKPGVSTNAQAASNPGAYNFYPGNSLATTYIPITFGIRF